MAPLRADGLFSDLDEGEVAVFLARATTREVPAGVVIMAEGEKGDGLHVVLSGTTEVVRQSGGRVWVIDSPGPGSVLGELSFVGGRPRSATVRTASDCTILHLDETLALELLAKGPSAARVLLAMADARLRSLQSALAAQDRLAALGTLTAGVAHELGNPASILLRGTSWLEGALPDADHDIEAVLREMAAAAGAVASLVERMRAGTGIGGTAGTGGNEAARNAGTPGAVGDAEVADGLGASIRETLVEAMVLLGWSDSHPLATGTGDASRAVTPRVHTDLPETLPRIRGDRVALVHVWTNLLANARDAVAGHAVVGSLPEGPAPIVVRAREESGRVIVEVEDRGHGIPESCRSQVFEPFFTTRAPGAGTGLGLHLVRTLVVESLQGSVDFTTCPGRTVFRVDLPAVRLGPHPRGGRAPDARTP